MSAEVVARESRTVERRRMVGIEENMLGARRIPPWKVEVDVEKWLQ